MTAPKGVRVTVERYKETHLRVYCRITPDGHVGDSHCYKELRLAGVPVLRPGESVTGRMVFVPDKKGRK